MKLRFMPQHLGQARALVAVNELEQRIAQAFWSAKVFREIAEPLLGGIQAATARRCASTLAAPQSSRRRARPFRLASWNQVRRPILCHR